jgi:hypothetical protein
MSMAAMLIALSRGFRLLWTSFLGLIVVWFIQLLFYDYLSAGPRAAKYDAILLRRGCVI